MSGGTGRTAWRRRTADRSVGSVAGGAGLREEALPSRDPAWMAACGGGASPAGCGRRWHGCRAELVVGGEDPGADSLHLAIELRRARRTDAGEQPRRSSSRPQAGRGGAWTAGGSPISSASRYSSEICWRAATTRFQDASVPAGGPGLGGADREHATATASARTVRLMGGQPTAAAAGRRRPALRAAWRWAAATRAPPGSRRPSAGRPFVLSAPCGGVLLHRPEGLELRVLELVDGAGLHHFHRILRDGSTDEAAERAPARSSTFWFG